ncbi:HK97 family phage prohead protease [Myxococcus xanthus]|uniref:HK97 family phage prohead protease n=1 Tax=Myxococcus xanthus TaxID=34 RepID=UPI0019175D6E|nr:HK97 family phage prohead protease [Myxococcus xanthus]QQR46529.1 HK97 family phage prohead protease [Myxococcus xanthus]
MKTKTISKLLSLEPAGGEGAPPVFRITSNSLDRHGDRVLAVKSDGTEFRATLLWNHNDWSPAIGFARCYQEGGEWLMNPVFDRVCETSKEVAAKVEAGTLNQCSIRFRPIQEPVPNADGGHDYPLVEVLEVSIVNIGANQDAVRLRSAKPGGRPPSADGAEGGLLKQMARRMKHLQAQMNRLLKALGEDAPEKADLDEEDDEEKELGEGDEEEANLDEEDDEEKDGAEDDDEEANLDEEDDEEKELGEDDGEEANLDEEDDEEKELGEDDGEEANLDEEDDEEKELGEDDDEEANLDEEDDEEEELPPAKAKVLRARLVNRHGFTQAQAKALSHADLLGLTALYGAK